MGFRGSVEAVAGAAVLAGATVLAGVILVLSGCSAPPLPAGPTSAELDARVAAERDRLWGHTGLEGVVERPVVPQAEPSEAFDPRRFDCMAEAGISSWGSDDDGLTMDDRDPTAQEQLGYYGCYARYPVIEMLSKAQLDYIYDYYARFLVPCLAAEGYGVQPVPRAEFVNVPFQGWRWSPYQALDPRPDDYEVFEALVESCPAALPGVEGWEDRPF